MRTKSFEESPFACCLILQQAIGLEGWPEFQGSLPLNREATSFLKFSQWPTGFQPRPEATGTARGWEESA
jgi:hypothetical protein